MTPLTDEEIAKLRKLAAYADQIGADMEYQAAKRLVVKTWRGLILALAGFVGAGLILKDAAKAAITSFGGGP